MDIYQQRYDEYGFPLEYGGKKLARMRNKRTISAEQYQTLQSYFEAAYHLYSLIPLGKLLEIYNQQNAHLSGGFLTGGRGHFLRVA